MTQTTYNDSTWSNMYCHKESISITFGYLTSHVLQNRLFNKLQISRGSVVCFIVFSPNFPYIIHNIWLSGSVIQQNLAKSKCYALPMYTSAFIHSLNFGSILKQWQNKTKNPTQTQLSLSSLYLLAVLVSPPMPRAFIDPDGIHIFHYRIINSISSILVSGSF